MVEEILIKQWEDFEDNFLKLSPKRLLTILDYHLEDLANHRQLVDQNSIYVEKIVHNLLFLGLIYRVLSRPAEAEKVYIEALAIYRQIDNAENQIFYTLCSLGGVQRDLDRPDDAEKVYIEALAIYRQIGIKNKYAIPVLGSLGKLYKENGRLSEEEIIYKEILAIHDQTKTVNDEAVVDLIRLGRAYTDLDRPIDVEKAYREAFTIHRQIDDEIKKENLAHPKSGTTFLINGVTYVREPDFDREREDAHKKQAIPILTLLTKFYREFHRYYDEIAAYEDLLAIYRELNNKTNEITVLELLIKLNAKIGQYEKVEAAYKEILKPGVIKFVRIDSHLYILESLGKFYWDIYRYNEAAQTLTEALNLYDNRNSGVGKSRDGARKANIFSLLGTVYRDAGRNAEAEATYIKAIEIYEANITLLHEGTNYSRGIPMDAITFWPEFIYTLNDLSILYSNVGQHTKEANTHKQALDFINKLTQDKLSSENALATSSISDRIAFISNKLGDLYIRRLKENLKTAGNIRNNFISNDKNDIVNRLVFKESKLSDFNKTNIDPEVQTFSSLTDVLTSIQNNTVIDGINISEKLLDPNFRFITTDFPDLSSILSETFAALIKKVKPEYAKKASKKGAEKRTKNADEFATEMYDIIGRIKKEKKITSYRETAKILNEQQIPTYRGGEWHLKTLQDLNNRWKELGLISEQKPK